MKNIAIIIPSLRAGGAERVASILSKQLSKKYNVLLIIFNGKKKAYSYGGTLIDLNIQPHSNFFVKIINFFRRAYGVRKVKKEYKIESTISFMFGANIVNLFSKNNDKVIVSVRSHLSKRPQNIISKINKKIISNMYNKADQVIGVSKGVSNDLIESYGIKEEIVNYIHNPIDIEKIKELATEELSEDEEKLFNSFTVINVGRLTHAKGQWHLIRAMSKVKEEIPQAKLLIIGEGELEDYFTKLIKDLNLEDTVFLLGYKENVFKYINRSDLFVLSSLYEGFPNVVLEAMACGVPVLSTDCPSGPREILAPNTPVNREIMKSENETYGVLTPIMDGKKYNASERLSKEEDLLSKKILEVYNNTPLRSYYSNQSLRRATDFDISIVLKKWQQAVGD